MILGESNQISDVAVPNLWVRFKDGVLEACDVMCGKKWGRRIKRDTWFGMKR